MATIQGVYVALFGRPADPTGLTFFKGVSNDGADLSAIGDLSSTKEYTDRFVGQTNVQIINSIYQSLFGHPADAAGLNFFIGELLAGRQTIQTIAINILDGAQGTDKEIVDRKIAAADAFTAALDTTAEIVGYTGNAAAASGVAFLATVTATAPTAAQVDAAVAAAVAAGGGAAGNTFTLTTTVGESVMGTSADDTINASVDFGGLSATPAATLNATDTIDGAGGVDTVNISSTSNAAAAAPSNGLASVPAGSIKNVEIVNLISDTPADGFVAGTANSANFAGVQQLWQIGATTPQDVTVAAGVTAGFQGTSNAAGAGGVIAAASTTPVGVEVALKSVANGSVIEIDETTAGSLTSATVNGSVAGAGGLTLDFDTSTGAGTAPTALATLNLGITSNGTITLVDAAAPALATIDAGASTGNLIFAGVPTTVTSFTGGSGVDTFTVTSGAAATLVGGAGNDVLGAGAGGSTITGGTGADAMTAGAGVDTFIINTGDSGKTAATSDTTIGFASGTDKFDFNLAAGSATNFLNGGASSGYTDALTNANTAMDGTVQYYFSDLGANGFLFVDVDLDGTADMGVNLTGTNTMVFSDIIA
jgi:hypothetical protein